MKATAAADDDERRDRSMMGLSPVVGHRLASGVEGMEMGMGSEGRGRWPRQREEERRWRRHDESCL